MIHDQCPLPVYFSQFIVLFIKNGFPYFPFVDPCYKTIAFNCGPHKLTRRLHLCSFNAKAKRKVKGAETNLFTSSVPEKAGFYAQDTHLQTKPIANHSEITRFTKSICCFFQQFTLKEFPLNSTSILGYVKNNRNGHEF